MQPGQQKITQFDEVTSTQSGDIIPIVRGGQNKKISVENFTGVLPEGWLTPAEIWTFSSYNSISRIGVITVPEGAAGRYPVGTRIWIKQGSPSPTNRYAFVLGSTNTSITIHMINETTLENLTIQQPFISQIKAPITPDNADFDNSLVTVNQGWKRVLVGGGRFQYTRSWDLTAGDAGLMVDNIQTPENLPLNSFDVSISNMLMDQGGSSNQLIVLRSKGTGTSTLFDIYRFLLGATPGRSSRNTITLTRNA